MKNMCDIIRDILPLYADNVCSEASRELVEEHLVECRECSDTLNKLKSTVYESDILKEKASVLKHNYKRNQHRTFLAGGVIAAILMIPIIVCLIVNISTGHALDWFFIVLASLLVTASVTVVPLMTMEKKFLYTSLSFLAALLMLLAVCCIYSGGRWFFIAAVSVLIGAATIILPILAHKYFPDCFWKRNKGLLVYCFDTILLFLLLLSIAVFIKSAVFFKYALLISAVSALPMWIEFFIVRYLKVNAIIRTGGFIVVLGAIVMFINSIINYIVGDPIPSLFSQDYIINTLVAICFFIAGLIFIAAGIVRSVIASKERVNKK